MSEENAISLTLEEANKNMLANAPIFSASKLRQELNKIRLKWLDNTTNQYFMLLNRELSDYTLFNFNLIRNKSIDQVEEAIAALKDCILNRGGCVSINKGIDDDSWEIWIRTLHDNQAHVYYLFPYDQGVIEL